MGGTYAPVDVVVGSSLAEGHRRASVGSVYDVVGIAGCGSAGDRIIGSDGCVSRICGAGRHRCGSAGARSESGGVDVTVVSGDSEEQICSRE